MDTFDVVVIGSGPGGYVAAIRCAQLGMKTALIEKYPAMGGTCLNVGCIPSKAMLDSSEHYFNAVNNFSDHGVEIKDVKANLGQMVKRKASVVEQTTKGIAFLMDKHKVKVFQGIGAFADPHTIEITPTDDKGKPAGKKGKSGGSQKIKGKNVIIATGSKPNCFPGMEPDKKRIITSTEALELKEIPKKMVVIGGGAIGLEMGSVYARLGTKVEVVEFMDSIIPTMDRALGKELLKVLKKEGMKFHFNHRVQEVKNSGKGVKVKALDKSEKEVIFEADYCLVSVGRKPYTEGLGLDKAGVKTDDKGRIEVNEQLQTGVSHIYAIGDVVRGPMLAHKASDEGVLVAELLAGQKPSINYLLIPNVVYTWPEVAGVGHTEEQLKEAGRAYKTGSFPMRALGRSRASGDTYGFVKILADEKTDEILGMHIIGARAADLIADGVTAMEYRASAEDIARMSHAHPTYSEAIKEAALDATEKRPLHM